MWDLRCAAGDDVRGSSSSLQQGRGVMVSPLQSDHLIGGWVGGVVVAWRLALGRLQKIPMDINEGVWRGRTCNWETSVPYRLWRCEWGDLLQA